MRMRGWFLVLAVVALSCLSVATDVAVAADPAPPSWGSSPAGVEPFNTQSSVLRMVGGMFLCFGLLGLGVHLYKRYVLPRNLSDKKRMQVVERLNLSQKSALVLVKLDGKEFLLSTGSEGCRVVSAPRDAEYLFDQTLTSACEEVKEFNA